MGDRPKAFEQEYTPIRDDTCGKMFTPGCVRSCPHPAVIAKFGTGGVANVSVYTCRKCRYVINHKWMGGVSCGYQAE